NCSRRQDANWRSTRGYLRLTSELQRESRGDLLPGTLDPLIKSANQRVERDHTDALNAQQLELWPDSEQHRVRLFSSQLGTDLAPIRLASRSSAGSGCGIRSS